MPLVSVFEALAKMFFSSALAFNRSRLVRLFLIRYGELFPALPPPALQHQAAAFAAHSSAEAQSPPPFGLARLKGAFHHPFSEKIVTRFASVIAQEYTFLSLRVSIVLPLEAAQQQPPQLLFQARIPYLAEGLLHLLRGRLRFARGVGGIRFGPLERPVRHHANLDIPDGEL
jgi:hypothetical protein